MRTMLFTLIAFTAVFGFGGFQMVAAETFTDFEPPGFVVGQSVNNLEPDGNTIAPPMSFNNSCREAWFIPTAGTDEEVVDLSPDPHGKVWRISTAVDSGDAGRSPHSPRNPGVISGETVSLPNDSCGPSTTSNFYGQVDFSSVTGSAQPGLTFVIDANSSDTRQAFVRLEDNGVSGFDLSYIETANGCTFPSTPIASDLSYTDWHTLGIEIFFVDGLASGVAGQPGAEGNDIVNIYVDTFLVYTGTTWESCIGARVVDQLLFETSNENVSFQGNGLYFDNVLVTDVCPVGNCNLPLMPLVLNQIFPGVASNPNTITVEEATPDGSVAFIWGFKTGSRMVGGSTCPGIELGINPAKLLGIINADSEGVAEFVIYIPFNPAFEMPVYTQAIDIETCRVSEVVQNIIISE